LAYSFSEAATEIDQAPKHVLRVEVGPHPEVTLRPLLPLRPLSRLTSSFEDFLNHPKWKPYEGHFVELTLSDASLVSQPMDRLRTRFPHLLSLLQKPLSTTASSILPLPTAVAGSLVTDTLAFLSDVAPTTLETGSPWVDRLAAEVLREAP
jgi:hypothetical protein